MNLLLDTLLNGLTFEEALIANGKAIEKIGSRKNVFSFKVTKYNGFTSTDIYPEIPKNNKDYSDNLQ